MVAAALIASVTSIVQLQDAILRVHDRLRISDDRVGEKQVARSLETSQQKLQIWEKTWLHNNPDTEVTSTVLWGTHGLAEIQKLFQTISSAVRKLEVVEKERHKIKSRPSFFNNENSQALTHDSIASKPRSRWKRALQQILEKKSPTEVVKLPEMQKLATELSSSIDELWTYSEVAFNSLHGLLTTRAVDSFSEPSIGNILADAIQTRTASMVLYRACSKSTRVCNLEIDLSGAKSQLRHGSAGSSNLSFSLFYHLLMQSCDSPAVEMLDLTIESIASPDETAYTESGEMTEYENPDLTVFAARTASDTGIVIRPKTARTRSYFRVAKLPEEITLTSETQNSAQTLYKGKVLSTTSSAQSLPFSLKIELAYKLVKSALYLLGTPWLASLSSERIRRMNVKDRRQPYFLDVQILDLDELSFEDPQALTESSQLFRIGVLLVDIALGDKHPAPTEIQESDLGTSKMLTLVQQSMGPQYCKATAFCLRDRRSISHFGLPEKYQYPEKTGWKSYLLELLEEYHAQVFLRLKEIRKKVDTQSAIEQCSLD